MKCRLAAQRRFHISQVPYNNILGLSGLGDLRDTAAFGVGACFDIWKERSLLWISFMFDESTFVSAIFIPCFQYMTIVHGTVDPIGRRSLARHDPWFALPRLPQAA